MNLTKPIEIPLWAQRAVPVASAAVLLFCAIDFLNWQFITPIRRGGSWTDDPGRCFDNAEPLMPLAALIHSHLLCPFSADYYGSNAPSGTVYGDSVRLCLYGGVIFTWLAARAISGWWAAGIASAFVATSPLLFGLAHQMSPAAVGVALAALSCWLAAEAFRQPSRGTAIAWQIAWMVSAVLCVSMHAATAWLIGGQALYGIVQGRAINAPRSAAIAAACLCGLTVVVSLIPTTVMASAIVRYDVRSVPLNIFAFAYPDEWMSQPHMATYLTIGFLLVLLAGAVVARSSILQYLVIAACAQALLGAAFSIGGIVKVTSLAYMVPVAAMALGATTEFLIARRPRMLAFVVPALAIAAQYAAFGRLPLAQPEAFDFDSTATPPSIGLARGDQLRLYHDAGSAEHLTVFHSFEALQYKGNERLIVPATTPVVVTNIAPYRSERRVTYGYEVAARDGSWRGFVNPWQVWFEPPIGSCIRQPSSKMRLYERPDVSFREEGHSIVEPPGTLFRVVDFNQTPYEPELRVQVVGGSEHGREGWLYAQAILRDDVGRLNREAGFNCDGTGQS